MIKRFAPQSLAAAQGASGAERVQPVQHSLLQSSTNVRLKFNDAQMKNKPSRLPL